MKLTEHLNKKNLHHAYLIEGEREEVLAELILFIESLGIKKNNNPDFSIITLDSFKVEDARNLRSLARERAMSNTKKVFIISANNFLLEAQNSMLKIFEEPKQDTHFFLITPDSNALLKTFVSRFYLIVPERSLENEKEAKKFIEMNPNQRINFIKELLTEFEDEEAVENSARSKANKFLNSLELVLHKQTLSRMPLDTRAFEQIFKVRKFLRQPGASAKTLMESIALLVPNF